MEKRSWLSAELQTAALEKIGVALRQPKPLSAMFDAFEQLSHEEAEVVLERLTRIVEEALKQTPIYPHGHFYKDGACIKCGAKEGEP